MQLYHTYPSRAYEHWICVQLLALINKSCVPFSHSCVRGFLWEWNYWVLRKGTFDILSNCSKNWLNQFRLSLILFTKVCFILANLKYNIKESLEKRRHFKYLKKSLDNPNGSPVILYSLPSPSAFYFSEVASWPPALQEARRNPGFSHLAIHSAVPSKRSGVMMLVSEATEAAQYALLERQKQETH